MQKLSGYAQSFWGYARKLKEIKSSYKRVSVLLLHAKVNCRQTAFHIF